MQEIEREIYQAAMERLPRRFTPAQAQRLASLMLAQAKLETGNFTSNVFKTNKNAYGYKYYKGSIWQAGPGVMSPEGNTYANFRTVGDSAKEVADWLGRRAKNFNSVTTPEAYAQALKAAGYYGTTWQKYAAMLRRFMQDIPAAPAAGTALALVAALGAALFFF